MTPEDVAAMIREYERLIGKAEPWRELPTTLSTTARIAGHLAALRAEQRQLIALLVRELRDAG